MALKIGIQMYSVRKAMAHDPLETIEKVAEAGYKYLEFANIDAYNDYGCGFGASAKAVGAACRKSGCQILGAHIDPIDKSNIDQVLRYHVELGSKYLVTRAGGHTKAEVEAASRLYEYLGRRCAREGIQFVLHSGFPHYDEFGEWNLDAYARMVSPEFLMYELDTYWIIRSDQDVYETIQKFGDRIVFIHEKDLPNDFSGVMNISSITPMGRWQEKDFDYVHPEEFIEIGEGQIDHQSLIDAAIAHTKATHMILEQDHTKLDEIESIRVSMNNFRKLNHVIA